MTNEQVAIDIATIKTTLTKLESQLLGNGQPGRIQKIEERLEDVEGFKDRTKGALLVIGALISTLGGVLWRHLSGK